MAAYMALDINPDHLEQETAFAEREHPVVYSQFDDWSGSAEATIQLVAIAKLASFYIWHEDDQAAYALVKPIWLEIVKQQPGLNLAWWEPSWPSK